VQPGGEGGRASFVIPKRPERVGAVADTDKLAAALSLKPADLGLESFAFESWNAGNPFTFVPLRGLDAMKRARPDMAHWDALFGAGKPPGAFLFCSEVAEPGHSFHARMFAPAMGIVEDPATGSAVAAFAGVLAASGLKDGKHDFTIEQGYEMGRPSLINLSIAMKGGAFEDATISGDAVVVSEGAIEA
jgi:trans-2,3-dihydro-3-hydroxyanthranilate isomerase